MVQFPNAKPTQPTCSVRSTKAGLFRCAGCYTTFFCSQSCQAMAWREHRSECARYQMGHRKYHVYLRCLHSTKILETSSSSKQTAALAASVAHLCVPLAPGRFVPLPMSSGRTLEKMLQAWKIIAKAVLRFSAEIALEDILHPDRV